MHRSSVRVSVLVSALAYFISVSSFSTAAQQVKEPLTSGHLVRTRPQTGQASESILSVDGVALTTLEAAVEACPQTCWIIDTYPENFAANPFANIGTKSVRVTLGRGTWTTPTTIVIPTKSQIEGSGRGDGGFSGTVIQASSSFPANTPLLEMGNARPSMGVRIENLTVDCAGIPGVIGIHNILSEEQSGVRNVLVENIAGIGLDVEESGAQNSGPYENLELYGAENSNVTSGTLCAKVLNVPAFRGIHSATCNFNNYSVHPAVGIQMDGSGTLTDIHIEGAENGIGIGISAPGTGAVLQNVYGGGPNIKNLVHVYSGQNIVLSGLVRSTTPVALVDDVLGQTATDTELALYVIGNGAPPNQSRFSSSVAPGAQSRLVDLTVSNLSVLNAIANLVVQRLSVTNLDVQGTITKRAGSFKIDDPIDPEHKVLQHSFVESPDMMNIYNGIVVLDHNGEAQVDLPPYFEALNRDFRYQLTPLGGYAPLFVSSEIKANSFRVAGGTPGLRVSWTVTGIRHDSYANEHRIPVESPKATQ